MTKTRSRVIQGWRQLSQRPGFAKRGFAFQPRQPQSGAAAEAPPPAAAAPTPRSDPTGKNAEFVTKLEQSTLEKVTASLVKK